MNALNWGWTARFMPGIIFNSVNPLNWGWIAQFMQNQWHEPCSPTPVQACLLNKKKSENALTRFRTKARSDMQLEPNHLAKLASCCSTITKKILEVVLKQFFLKK